MFDTIPPGTTPCAISTHEEAHYVATRSIGLFGPNCTHMVYHYLASDVRVEAFRSAVSSNIKSSALVAEHVSIYGQMVYLVDLHMQVCNCRELDRTNASFIPAVV